MLPPANRVVRFFRLTWNRVAVCIVVLAIVWLTKNNGVFTTWQDDVAGPSVKNKVTRSGTLTHLDEATLEKLPESLKNRRLEEKQVASHHKLNKTQALTVNKLVPAQPSPPLRSGDALVDDVLRCFEHGRDSNTQISYYFDLESSLCRPLPQQLTDDSAADGSGHGYRPPPDVSVVPVIDAFDRDYAASSEPQRSPLQRVGSHHRIIVERSAPSSADTKWLFNDWRLWEGELGLQQCADRANQVTTPQNAGAVGLDSFQSVGSHRATNPNSLYQLDNFCLDEEDGSLFEFQLDGGQARSRIEMPQGVTDHPASPTYEPNTRVFHASNRVKIPLVAGPQGAPLTFRSVVTASLNHFYESLNASSSAEVFFEETPALFHPLQSGDDNNPGHTNHRIATSAAIKGVLGVRSVIFTTEAVVPRPTATFCSKACNSLLFAPLLLPPSVPAPAAELAVLAALPKYLLSTHEAAWLGSADVQKHAGAYLKRFTLEDFSKLLSARRDQNGSDIAAFAAYRHLCSGTGGASLPSDTYSLHRLEGFTRHNSLDIIHSAMLDVNEQSVQFQFYKTLYGMLLSSPSHSADGGASGTCEAFRCKEEGPLTCGDVPAYRQCATPYIALLMSYHKPLSVPLEAMVGTSVDASHALSGEEKDRLRAYLTEMGIAARSGGTTATANTDTANYTRRVWHGALRSLYRETKRIRRDILLHTKHLNSGKGMLSDPFEDQHANISDPTGRIAMDLAAIRASSPKELADIILDSPLSVAFSPRPPSASPPDGGPSPTNPPSSAPPPSPPFAYMLVWRARVMRSVASAMVLAAQPNNSKALNKGIDPDTSSATNDPPLVIGGTTPHTFVLRGYMEELFAVLLDRLQSAEQFEQFPDRFIPSPSSSSSAPAASGKKPSRLVCYKTAYATHIRYNSGHGRMERTSVNAFAPSNCHHRESLQYAYSAMWQRYGTCGAKVIVSGETNKKVIADPALDTSRDAHPLFTLPFEEHKQLRAVFAESEAATNRLLAEAVKGLASAGLSTEKGTVGDFFGGNDVRPRNPNPAVQQLLHTLIQRVDEAQGVYDDALMSYFARKGVASRPVWARTAGRPIRLYQAHRSTKRAFAYFRQHMTRLSTRPSPDARTMFDFIDVEFAETASQYPDAFTLRNSSRRPYRGDVSPLNTPRARQVSAAMRADVLFGPHGAEMHNLVFLKPSAFVHELALSMMDGGSHFNGGFFGNYAFGKKVGYLRTFMHRVWTFADPVGERKMPSTYGGVFGGQTFLTLPDLRQVYGLHVCAWLATNSVRLADEEREAAHRSNSDSKKAVRDFGHLVPWWCRGGATATVRLMLQKSFSAKSDDRAASLANVSSFKNAPVVLNDQDTAEVPLPSLRSLTHPSYYTVRMVPTAYGFVQPYCPPLHSASGQESSAEVPSMAIARRRHIDYETLIRLQNECAVGVTLGTQGTAMMATGRRERVPESERAVEALRLKVEALQTLLEAVFLNANTLACQMSARLVVGGVPLLANGTPATDFIETGLLQGVEAPPTQNCAACLTHNGSLVFSADMFEERSLRELLPLQLKVRDCLRAMLTLLSTGVPTSGPPLLDPRMSETLLRVRRHFPPQTFAVSSEKLRSRVIHWMIDEFMRVGARPTLALQLPMPLQTDAFSYGHNCTRWM